MRTITICILLTLVMVAASCTSDTTPQTRTISAVYSDGKGVSYVLNPSGTYIWITDTQYIYYTEQGTYEITGNAVTFRKQFGTNTFTGTLENNDHYLKFYGNIMTVYVRQ